MDHGGMEFDGLAGDIVFCAWTGSTPLSEQRAECLLSIYRETHCPVLLVTPANLADWIVPASLFHPAFSLLSEVHRADYLRCYFMHHHGGGYTDIKRTTASWRPHFARLRASPDADGLGYQEIGPHGIPHVSGPFGDLLRANFRDVIGNCAYIFRKRTALTQHWIDQTHAVLDAKLALLQQHPAQHPMDQTGVTLPDGSTSLYPLRWAELLGEVFHPLVYRHRERILQADIAPQFTQYR